MSDQLLKDFVKNFPFDVAADFYFSEATSPETRKLVVTLWVVVLVLFILLKLVDAIDAAPKNGVRVPPPRDAAPTHQQRQVLAAQQWGGTTGMVGAPSYSSASATTGTTGMVGAPSYSSASATTGGRASGYAPGHILHSRSASPYDLQAIRSPEPAAAARQPPSQTAEKKRKVAVAPAWRESPSNQAARTRRAEQSSAAKRKRNMMLAASKSRQNSHEHSNLTPTPYLRRPLIVHPPSLALTTTYVAMHAWGAGAGASFSTFGGGGSAADKDEAAAGAGKKKKARL